MAWSLQNNKETEDHFKAEHSKHPVNKGPRGSKGFEFRDEDFVGSSSPLRDLGKLRVRRGNAFNPFTEYTGELYSIQALLMLSITS